MLYLYYSKVKGMMLANTKPSNSSDLEWPDDYYRMQVGNIIFNRPFITLVGPSKDQVFARYAIQIDAVGKPGDEYEDI